MTKISECLHRPVEVQGRKVVFVPEVVGTVPIREQHEYVELVPATNLRPAINVRESDIEQARVGSPGVPIYGMWQTLIESGGVSFNHTLQVVPLNSLDGFYLYCDVGRANYSGVYEAGFFAAEEEFNLEDAYEVNPELSQLVLPSVEAKLAKEMLQERRIEQRSAWTSLGLTLLLILGVGFSTDFTLKKIYAHKYATLENKSELLKNVQTGLEQLRNTRLTEVPDDSDTLEKIASLWALDKSIQSVGASSFENRHFEFSLSGLESDPSKIFDWVKATAQPDGSWNVDFRKER